MKKFTLVFLLFIAVLVSAFTPPTAVRRFTGKLEFKLLNAGVLKSESVIFANGKILKRQSDGVDTVADIIVDMTGLEQLANKDEPNGYAGLDAEGKLNAELVETITVMFTGAEAVDVQ